VRIVSKGFDGGEVTLAGGISSQFLSSVLLAAPCGKRNTTIHISGEIPSWPYVQMTIDVMGDFGIHVERRETQSFFVAPQQYGAETYTVEGDASSATYFMAAAAICGGSVHIANMNPHSTQADMRFGEILYTFGCVVDSSDAGLVIRGPLTNHEDWSFDLKDSPDMVPALAVVCAFRKGKTVLENIAHLRVKECDRISALTTELRKLGATVEEEHDKMTVTGVASKGAEINCYEDHRIAMSFAIAGLRLQGVVISDPGCVRKSFPDFWEQLERLY
jgi:3-phosphoshikimate 1-carboxyvinyltransferase